VDQPFHARAREPGHPIARVKNPAVYSSGRNPFVFMDGKAPGRWKCASRSWSRERHEHDLHHYPRATALFAPTVLPAGTAAVYGARSGCSITSEGTCVAECRRVISDW
jgi:hypothetical protein